MQLEKKYRLVNWVDGMKINQDHFRALEDSLLESLHLNTNALLPEYGFGLLPASIANVDPFGLEVTPERIEIYKCLAITRDGILIQVNNSDAPGLKRSIQDLLQGQALGGAQTWYVLLRVNSHQRSPDGLPDPDEVPLRHPFAVPDYSIELVSEDSIQGNHFLQASLPLARIIISRESGNRVDADYIPPVTTVRSHTRLYERYKELERQVFEVDRHLAEIIRKAKDKQRQNVATSISDDLLEMASALSWFIGSNIDNYMHFIQHQSPLHLQVWFIRMARVLESAFRYFRDKDNTFHYCEKYSTHHASFLEAGVQQVLNLQYNHLNIEPTLSIIETWVSSLRNLLQTLAGLHYNDLGKPGILSPNPPPSPPTTEPSRGITINPSQGNKGNRGASRPESNEGTSWNLSD